MLNEEQVIKEIDRRLAFNNPKSYGSYRSNHTFIRALCFVLEIDIKGFQEEADIKELIKLKKQHDTKNIS